MKVTSFMIQYSVNVGLFNNEKQNSFGNHPKDIYCTCIWWLFTFSYCHG